MLGVINLRLKFFRHQSDIHSNTWVIGAPNMWLNVSFLEDTSAKWFTIRAILGPLPSMVITLGTLPLFWYLEKKVLLAYVLVDLGFLVFIVVLVPETIQEKKVLLPYVLEDLGFLVFIVALVLETTHVIRSVIVTNVCSQR